MRDEGVGIRMIHQIQKNKDLDSKSSGTFCSKWVWIFPPAPILPWYSLGFVFPTLSAQIPKLLRFSACRVL